MPTITLRPTGAAFNASVDANITVVGSSPQWADSSDSSYATGDSNATNSRANMAAPLEPLVLPAGATVTGIRATVRLSASGGTEAQVILMFGPSSFIPNQFACYFTSNTSDLSDNGTYGLTGTPTDIDLVVATESDVSADPLTTLQGTPYVGVATSGLEAVTVYEFTVFVDYDGGSIDLPCDTWVGLDLSSALFTTDPSDGLTFGQYGDGVIYGVTKPGAGAPNFPDFYFPFTLDPLKSYRVEVTFDPSSSHDAGGRGLWLTGVEAGSEQDYNTVSGFPFGNRYDGGSNTADVVTVTIGPGVEQWDDGTYGVAAGYSELMFETDRDGAVSAIRVRKVCTTFAPPQRLINRDDMYASARRVTGSTSRQGSNRLTGYL